MRQKKDALKLLLWVFNIFLCQEDNDKELIIEVIDRFYLYGNTGLFFLQIVGSLLLEDVFDHNIVK